MATCFEFSRSVNHQWIIALDIVYLMADMAFPESVKHPRRGALAGNSLFSPYYIHRSSSLPLHESDTEVGILVIFLQACQGTGR